MLYARQIALFSRIDALAILTEDVRFFQYLFAIRLEEEYLSLHIMCGN